MPRSRQQVWECTSPGREYRATVLSRSWDGLFEVELWSRQESDPAHGPVVAYWNPLENMSLADTEGAARRVAKQRLEHASGEPVDLTPYPITVEWIRDFSGDPSADFVDPGSVEVRFDGGHINALQVIRLSGLYLVREDTSQPDWWIGAESEPGRLLCWAVYGNLYDAIESR